MAVRTSFLLLLVLLLVLLVGSLSSGREASFCLLWTASSAWLVVSIWLLLTSWDIQVIILYSFWSLLCFLSFFENRIFHLGQSSWYFFLSKAVMPTFLFTYIKYIFLQIPQLLQYLIKHNLRTSLLILLLIHKNLRHPLRNELKRFHIILILIQLPNIITIRDLPPPRLSVYSLKQNLKVLVTSSKDLRSYCHVCYTWPWLEEVYQELSEIHKGDCVWILSCDHLEWYFCLRLVISYLIDGVPV